MKKHIYMIAVLLSLASQSARASAQEFELVAGVPESIDLRYGFEWKYFGIAVNPGLGLLVKSSLENNDQIPITWNPSLSLFKNIGLTNSLYLTPNISGTYVLGYNGMVGAAECSGCSEFKTRFDRQYIKASLGFRYFFNAIFVEVNPGLASYYEREYVTEGSLPSSANRNGQWSFGGLYVSAGVGYRLKY